MLRITPRIVVLVAAFTVLPLAGAAVENDGGSGGDAPNTATGAYPVAFGTIAGYLGNDQDWYQVGAGATSPVCIQTATTGGDADSDLELRVGATRVTGDGNTGSDAAFVTESGAALLLGVLPTLNPASNTPSRPGTYTITTASRALADLGSGDAGTGGDVGNDPSSARDLSDACVAGDVRAGIDPRDVYGFAAAAGNVVRLSYVQVSENGTTRASLVDPDGFLVTVLGDGSIQSVTLAKTGTYTLAIGVPEIAPATSSTAAATPLDGGLERVVYLAGFDLDDPQGCRPNCL